MQPTITMPEIARLAGVTRQAVTNWRTRRASVPFPAAVAAVAGVERFDRDEVVEWLEATGRGNNAEARLDAAASSSFDRMDLDRAVTLLALRAQVSEDLGPITPEVRIALAYEVDPEDTWLFSEAREAAHDDDLAVYVDELMAASYGPADAVTRLYATRAATGARGLSDELIALMRAVAEACRTHLGPDDVAVDLRIDPRDRAVAAGFTATCTRDRALLRHLVLDGLALERSVGRCVRVVSAVGHSDVDALDVADETALELADGEVALVLGPASAFCDRLTGSAYEARRGTLELGSLVAAFRLPRGLWRRAHRKSLGLWVLRGGAESRGAVVADLSGVRIEPEEVAADVLGALAQTQARSYRYGRPVPYVDVWTRDTVVVPGMVATGVAALRPPAGQSTYERLVEATLLTRETVEGVDVAVAPSRSSRVAARSLGELVDAGVVRVLSGSRFAEGDLDETSSVRVLGADGVRGRIDPLLAADVYGHAVRTEPGDVVFAVSPPTACVDAVGGSRVASPSRILRLREKAGIGPRALAAAINEAQSSETRGSEWRTWAVPHVPPREVAALEAALARVQEHIDELRRREEAARSVMRHMLNGVAEGSVSLIGSVDRKAG